MLTSQLRIDDGCGVNAHLARSHLVLETRRNSSYAAVPVVVASKAITFAAEKRNVVEFRSESFKCWRLADAQSYLDAFTQYQHVFLVRVEVGLQVRPVERILRLEKNPPSTLWLHQHRRYREGMSTMHTAEDFLHKLLRNAEDISKETGVVAGERPDAHD